MSYPKNSASPPKLFATVVKAADGTAITSGVAAKYSTGAGSQAAGGGTCQHEGNGQWSYAPTQAETNVDGFGVQFYHTDAVGSGPNVSVVTSASVVQTGDSYARLGAPVGASVSADIAALPTVAEFNARTLAAADYTVVSDLPAAAPSAADNATAAAVAILVTPANKLATGASGIADANVTQLDGSTTPVDNLVLSLGAGGLVEKLNSMLEAAGLAYRFTAEALAEAPSGSGLTAQETANAVHNLAPTGTPAVESIGKHIDDLLAAAAAIQAITDNIDVTDVTVTTSNNAGELTIERTATFAATVSGLAIPADWLAVIWTVKGAASDDDDDAVLQVRVSNPAVVLTDGLQRIEGVAPSGSLTIASGSCTVNQAGGTVVLALKAAATAALTVRGGAAWDLRVLRPPTGEADELTTGTADIVYTVTHART